jgi:hypothetical protein
MKSDCHGEPVRIENAKPTKIMLPRSKPSQPPRASSAVGATQLAQAFNVTLFVGILRTAADAKPAR